MTGQHERVTIGTISGGIVNFGGAVYISPITITKTISGSENSNPAQDDSGNSDSE
ncbi:hypothetical protein ACWM35_09120 [Neobacillus sp. K501]